MQMLVKMLAVYSTAAHNIMTATLLLSSLYINIKSLNSEFQEHRDCKSQFGKILTAMQDSCDFQCSNIKASYM